MSLFSLILVLWNKISKNRHWHGKSTNKTWKVLTFRWNFQRDGGIFCILSSVIDQTLGSRCSLCCFIHLCMLTASIGTLLRILREAEVQKESRGFAPAFLHSRMIRHRQLHLLHHHRLIGQVALAGGRLVYYSKGEITGTKRRSEREIESIHPAQSISPYPFPIKSRDKIPEYRNRSSWQPKMNFLKERRKYLVEKVKLCVPLSHLGTAASEVMFVPSILTRLSFEIFETVLRFHCK